MKRFICFVLALVLCLWGAGAVLAAEPDALPVADLGGAASSEVAVPYAAGEELVAVEVLDLILTVLQEVRDNTKDDPVTVIGADAPVVTKDLLVPPARTGLSATMEDIFGAYTPLTYQVTTVSGGTTTVTTEIVPGLAGVDWPYLGGVCLFGVMLYCLYRLIGGVLK